MTTKTNVSPSHIVVMTHTITVTQEVPVHKAENMLHAESKAAHLYISYPMNKEQRARCNVQSGPVTFNTRRVH